MKFSNRIYDTLVWLTQVVLPALGTLYVALAAIWGLPYAEAVAGTVTAVVLFLGVVLGVSRANYRADARHAEIEQ